MSQRLGWVAWECRGCTATADESEGVATIHAALDAAVNLLDTGDFYGMGHNELLIARALELQLEPEELGRVEQAMPADAVAGDRYDEAQMAHLDSER